jgi:hypothetical protein
MHHSYRIVRSWIWELVSVFIAIGSLVAIATLLTSYDGKPAPDWGTQLNLNALLAFLSTILRAMMVVIVSQIICQQKWDWYLDNTRPLSDLQQFDSGSRGSFGALLLIPTVILKDTITLIAAAVLVLSFLVGPFVQQASRTAPCSFPAPGQNASIPYAHYVPRQDGYTRFPGHNGYPTPDTTLAILSSVIAPDSVENQISGSCSTGECTFPNTEEDATTPKYDPNDNLSVYSTVGMCNRCVDVSSLVSRVDCGSGSCNGTKVQYILPNGLNVTEWDRSPSSFAKIQPTSDLQWLGDLLTPELRAMSKWAYVNATFLASKTENDVKAAVCVLYPCLRTYTALIKNNSLIEREITSQVMLLESEVAGSDMMRYQWANAQSDGYCRYTAIRSPCRVDNRVYDATSNTTRHPEVKNITLYDFTKAPRVTIQNFSVPESCVYRHEGQFVTAIADVFHRDIFDGECSAYKWISCGKSDEGSARLVSIGAGAVLQRMIEGEVSYSNVTSWFDSFANAMTSRLRLQFGAAFLNETGGNIQPAPLGEVQGIAWRTETCVSAHKDWLALPICLTAITSLLMLWTMAKNWRHRRTRPVWKDSLLPLLFYRNKIDCDQPETLPWRRNNDIEFEDMVPLLEAVEIEKISKRTPVSFGWPLRAKLGSEIESADTSAIALQLQDTALLPTQQRLQDTDLGSVTETVGSFVQDEQRVRRIPWENNIMQEE